MAGRPGALPWDMSVFTGNEPVTTLSDNFSFLNNQINDSGAGFTSYAIDTGTVNNLIVTLASAPVAYESGMMFCTKPAFTNTAASVVNVNALGNVSILNAHGGALTGGELPLNFVVTLVYNGSAFVIVGNQYQPVTASFTGTTGFNVNCDGASSISAFYTFNGAATASVLFQRLRTAIPVTLAVNFAFNSTLFVTSTNPAGGSITSSLAVQGTSGIQTGLSGNGVLVVGSGMVSGGVLTMAFNHT